MTDPFRDDIAALAEHVHQLVEENRALAEEVERWRAKLGPAEIGEPGRDLSMAEALRAQALETLARLGKGRDSARGANASPLDQPSAAALRAPRAPSKELRAPDDGGLLPLTRASPKEVVTLVGIGILLGFFLSRGH
jgi:hypothetical protein